MLIIQGVTYTHANKDLLFDDIDLIINKHDKAALIGNNGAGKSTLLRIIAGELQPSKGLVKAASKPYYVPQIFGQFNHLRIADALGVGEKLKALREILDGKVTEENLLLLDDDWTLEERCREAFEHWKIGELQPGQEMGTLSGGQKTKVFLAGIMLHRPEVVLMDEPSNHLDTSGRNLLYEYVRHTSDTLLVVSHDRTLLNLSDTVYELDKRGVTVYGGNYDFYAAQKKLEQEALMHELQHKEKTLRKAKETERESMERKNKLDARGKRKQEKAGLPAISMNTFKNNAEKSTARLKGAHAEKVNALSQELDQLRKERPGTDKMKMDLDHSALHQGKILVTAKDVNFAYHHRLLWEQPLSFQVTSGERIAVKGLNGSGKTTLIRMLLGELVPNQGNITRADVRSIYIDQDYSLINNDLSVYEQAQQYNSGALQEHEIRTRLNRFLFTSENLDKSCSGLSGGEKMRLILCCLMIGDQAPDMIVLDEPTNNLDMQNIEILTTAINEYQGTLLVVSHDEYFLKQVEVKRSIVLK